MKLFSFTAVAGALALSFPTLQDGEAPALPEGQMGAGEHIYQWTEGWGELPNGVELGNTHGCIVVDSKGRVYFNTDTKNAVCIFSADGEFIDAWGGRELEGGVHGMTIVEEAGEEFLYLAHTGRHEILKVTLEGEIVWKKGYPEESRKYQKKEHYNPTSIAFAPDGRFFVADGYGQNYIHQYDADGNWVKTFGGPGSKPGQMRTPHGIWVNTRGSEPLLVVADRENRRLQWFDLEGEFQSEVREGIGRACNIHQRGDHLVIADLLGKVTILDGENNVVCHLGQQPDRKKAARNNIPKEQWKAGEFISAHAARWDEAGNLYVMDWVAQGRVTKLQPVD